MQILGIPSPVLASHILPGIPGTEAEGLLLSEVPVFAIPLAENANQAEFDRVEMAAAALGLQVPLAPAPDITVANFHAALAEPALLSVSAGQPGLEDESAGLRPPAGADAGLPTADARSLPEPALLHMLERLPAIVPADQPEGAPSGPGFPVAEELARGGTAVPLPGATVGSRDDLRPDVTAAPTGAKPDNGGRPDTGGRPDNSGRPDTGGMPENGGRPDRTLLPAGREAPATSVETGPGKAVASRHAAGQPGLNSVRDVLEPAPGATIPVPEAKAGAPAVARPAGPAARDAAREMPMPALLATQADGTKALIAKVLPVAFTAAANKLTVALQDGGQDGGQVLLPAFPVLVTEPSGPAFEPAPVLSADVGPVQLFDPAARLTRLFGPLAIPVETFDPVGEAAIASRLVAKDATVMPAPADVARGVQPGILPHAFALRYELLVEPQPDRSQDQPAKAPEVGPETGPVAASTHASAWRGNGPDGPGVALTLPAIDVAAGMAGVADQGLAGPADVAPGIGTPDLGVAGKAPAPVLSQVTSHIVERFAKEASGAATVTLSPEELGRVQIRFQPDADNPDRMTVMLTFDRPETMDLFRRHAEQLADVLRTAGYSGVQIGFGAPAGDGFRQNAGAAVAPDQGSPDPENPAGTETGPAIPRPTGPGGLDLRL